MIFSLESMYSPSVTRVEELSLNSSLTSKLNSTEPLQFTLKIAQSTQICSPLHLTYIEQKKLHSYLTEHLAFL
jgi:hypothetical protein